MQGIGSPNRSVRGAGSGWDQPIAAFPRVLFWAACLFVDIVKKGSWSAC